MITFDKPTTAYQTILNRKPNRNEIENGRTFKEIDGYKCFNSIRAIKTIGNNFESQTISPDYKTITLTREKASTADYYLANQITNSPIHYFIGGEFKHTIMAKTKYKMRPNVYGYKMAPKIVKHEVLYAQYIVTNVEYNNDDTANIQLELVD